MSKSKWKPALLAALALLVAAPLAGAAGGHPVPNSSQQAAMADAKSAAAERDLRSPDARDAASPLVTPSKSPVAVPDRGSQPALATAEADFPWAGMLVGVGLAAMAGLLALVAVRGTRARPLRR